MPKTNRTAESIKEGTQFYEWTVLGLSGKYDYLFCKCSCGNTKDVNVYSLKSGKSKSCGCKSADLMRETIDKRNGR